ncbi:MAG: membrane protein insertase YidC [Deltaproteobacteria bacterium]|nr:membrane protein insertase YidC [Deltaproteobacteria bacterium]
MDKRTFWVMFGSFVAFALFYTLLPPPNPTKPPGMEEPPGHSAALVNPGTPTTGAKTGAVSGAAPQAGGAKAQLITIQTRLYTAQVSTQGGRLVGLQLSQYNHGRPVLEWPHLFSGNRPPEDSTPMEMVKHELPQADMLGVAFAGNPGLTSQAAAVVYSARTGEAPAPTTLQVGDSPRTLTLTGRTSDGVILQKTITFYPDNYIVDFRLLVHNNGKAQQPLQAEISFGEGPRPFAQHGAMFQSGWYGAVYQTGGKVKDERPKDLEEPLLIQNPDWVGYSDNYFLSAFRPEGPVAQAFVRGVPVHRPEKDNEVELVGYQGVTLPPVDLAPGHQFVSPFRLYMGPKDTFEMRKFGHTLENALDFSTDFLGLNFLSHLLLAVMRWFNGFTGNYGLAIIMLTLLVRFVLFPVTYKGMLSMKRLQKFQPKMKALQERYKNDRERLGKEMMEFYKKHKVNPVSGCLPLLLQFPIFFSLYTALLYSIELRHAPFFGWIEDLSSRDGLYILPVIMGVTMVLQQRMSPPPADPVQAKMFKWLPVVFAFMMANFPAGLVLYWSVSNTLSIAQQYVINRAHIAEPAD